MPTALDRIQTLLQPDVFAQVRTLAKHNRRTLSGMAAELIDDALKLDKYKDQLADADVVVPPREDPRKAAPQAQFRDDTIKAAIDGADLNTPKLQKLLKLMELLDD